MTRDQLIETMARALEPDAWFNRENAFADFPDVADEVVLPSLNMARAALAALEAAGMRVVPVENDPTNPFAPRERPKKSIRLMTDAERRTAGLDPNGGFDGPTGAE